MVRRFLQRLEQGVLGTGGEHVDLVEEVHLGPARGAQGDPGEQVAHVVDLVVGRRVQLVQVERGTGIDGHAGLTRPARFTVDHVRAVQRLGQDPRGRSLAGSTGAAEQVGVEYPVLPHGIPEGGYHVLLSPDLRESPGPEAPVERRVLHAPTLLRHRNRDRWPSTGDRRREWDSNPR